MILQPNQACLVRKISALCLKLSLIYIANCTYTFTSLFCFLGAPVNWLVRLVDSAFHVYGTHRYHRVDFTKKASTQSKYRTSLYQLNPFKFNYLDWLSDILPPPNISDYFLEENLSLHFIIT